MQKKALILFSGGLDSTTCLAFATKQGFKCYALSFIYGQKHNAELKAAQAIAQRMGVEHHIHTLQADAFKDTALVNPELSVPDYQPSKEIPITYVPARNTIFLSIALAYAEMFGAYDIFTGVSAVDYSNYTDCRPEYIAAFEKLANLATKQVGINTFQIHAPLIHLSKAQTVELGIELGVDYSQTVTCYRADENGRACGNCDPCFFRKKGFREANITDPTTYSQKTHDTLLA